MTEIEREWAIAAGKYSLEVHKYDPESHKFFRLAIEALKDVRPARRKGEFTRQELENWLYSMCLNNDGTDFCKEIIDEIISRLDGFEKYVEDMRGARMENGGDNA